MTPSTLEIILRGANIIRGVLRTTNAYQDLNQSEIPTTTKICAIAGRILGLGFTIYETEEIIHHASYEHLMQIKDFEMAEKLFELATSLAVMQAKQQHPDPTKTEIQNQACLLEQELLSTGLDLLRVWNQRTIYHEEYLIEHPPADSMTDPHFHFHDPNSAHPVIDTDLHKSNIFLATEIEVLTTLAGTVLEARPIRTSCEYNHQQQALERQVQMEFVAPDLEQRAEPVVYPRLQALREKRLNQRIENLLTLTFIPPHLYENDPDSLFQRFECCISLAPARHPVKDPTATGDRKVIYDELTILEYLYRLQLRGEPLKSPVTGLRLQPSDLIPMIAAQRLIDTKLSSIQQRWESILQSHPELRDTPADPNYEEIFQAARNELGNQFFNEA